MAGYAWHILQMYAHTSTVRREISLERHEFGTLQRMCHALEPCGFRFVFVWPCEWQRREPDTVRFASATYACA